MTRLLLILTALAFLIGTAEARWTTGTVASIERQADGRVLTVVVLGGDAGESDKVSFIEEPAAVRVHIQNEITRRNQADAAITTDVKVGTVVTVPAVVIQPPPTPIPFCDVVILAAQLATLAKLGVLDPGDKMLADAVASARTLFDASLVSCTPRGYQFQ